MSQLEIPQLARELALDAEGVRRTVELLDAGNTVPFITRYRRDQTGGIDEEQIERIRDRVRAARALEERKGTILRSLEGQNKLTDELRKHIDTATTLKRLDDLYLPYKPKKQSLAGRARQQGLEPLADEIVNSVIAEAELEKRAEQFVDADKEAPDVASVLVGAGHILAERYAEDAELRRRARKLFRKTGKLVAKQVEDAPAKKLQVYKDFLDYREPLAKAPAHRVLAINRGERAKLLRVGVEGDAEGIEKLAIELHVANDHAHHEFLVGALRDAITRLLIPSLEREARRELTDNAESHSVQVFARNLKKLLLQPPLPGKRVLAIDPGYKNGCKLATLNEFGGVQSIGLVHLVGANDEETKAKRAEARQELIRLVKEDNLNLIAIGNGKACRPTEELVGEILADELRDREMAYIIVNEAGASVYSTSTIGREELPDYDATQRSAISIGRRMQDPLSELVKIDPASIGVGLYQHDAKAKPMRDSLDEVVQSCVSFVGVDVNSASAALLRYVSGLNQLTARRITEHRQEHGPFRNRTQLMDVNGVGDVAYVQAAGFLKVESGDNPLDATWVHPESYPVVEQLLAKLSIEPAAFTSAEGVAQFKTAIEEQDRAALAESLEIGRYALEQLIDALSRPGRDLREDLPPPVFRRDVVRFEDLHEGMELRGTVLNVVDFGAFVDVGLSDSGLVHVSRMSNDYVRDPHAIAAVGDQVRVWVASIDKDRRRVALSMIEPGTEKTHAKPKRHERGGKKQRPADNGNQGSQQQPSTDKTSGDSSRRQSRKSQATGNKRQGDKRRADKRQGDKRSGGRRQEQRTSDSRGRVYEKRAKGPAPKITQEMQEGKEAMRTFGDLLQFVQQKDDPSDDNANGDGGATDQSSDN